MVVSSPIKAPKCRQEEYVGRFAPSPSGELHFGSVVTAVASYIRSKQQKGKWLLRIDDLDKKRVKEGSRELILKGISSLGLEWDGLSAQSENLYNYRATMNKLARMELTYNCACSRKQLPKGAYPGTCRQLQLRPSKNHSVRLKTIDLTIVFQDLVFGVIKANLFTEKGDFVIKPRDEDAAYQLAVVVDDSESGVSEVVRGADLLSSTSMQVYLYEQLQITRPRFLHIPVVRDSRGVKLSKRTGAKSFDIENAKPVLALALEYLGYQLPFELEKANCKELLNWATDDSQISILETIQSRFRADIKKSLSS